VTLPEEERVKQKGNEGQSRSRGSRVSLAVGGYGRVRMKAFRVVPRDRTWVQGFLTWGQRRKERKNEGKCSKQKQGEKSESVT